MIDEREIEKLAQLARIKISKAEVKKLSADIESILAYVSDIQSVSSPTPLGVGAPTSSSDDLVGVESVGADSSPYNISKDGPNNSELINVMREDDNPHPSGLYTQILLARAPQREGDYIKVKKIL